MLLFPGSVEGCSWEKDRLLNHTPSSALSGIPSGLGHRQASKARQYLFTWHWFLSRTSWIQLPLRLPLRDWFQTWLTQAPTCIIKGCKVERGRRMNWRNGEGFPEKSYWTGLAFAFARMRVSRIPNPWNSHWCSQSVLGSNYFGEIQIKTKTCFLTTSGFGYCGMRVHGTCSEKGDGMWGGPGLGLWPPWSLGPAPIFQWDFPAKYVSRKGFVDFMRSLPFLPAVPTPGPWNNFLVPHQATCLIPNSLLAPQVILWVLLQRLWNLIFCSKSWLVLTWPSVFLIKLNTRSAGLPGTSATRWFPKQVPRNSKSRCRDPLLSFGS